MALNVPGAALDAQWIGHIPQLNTVSALLARLDDEGLRITVVCAAGNIHAELNPYIADDEIDEREAF